MGFRCFFKKIFFNHSRKLCVPGAWFTEAAAHYAVSSPTEPDTELEVRTQSEAAQSAQLSTEIYLRGLEKKNEAN